jgi:hypothetical protein
MTDRELLELAAKAAGLTILRWPQENYAVVLDGDDRCGWSPLIFDSDALRLAVKLGIGVAIPNKKFPNVRRAFCSDIGGWSVTDPDVYAATRRAIVMAAAEIGRNMP